MLVNQRKIILSFGAFCASLLLAIGCAQILQSYDVKNPVKPLQNTPIVIGYSNWAGWWPWAIAEQEGLFAKNKINVQMKWFDNYLDSLESFAAGQLDGNCQTLNDTISFAADAVNGEVIILVNDNSAGNDKIIVTKDINTIEDLKDKKVAVEEGVVTDFLLNLALESKGMKRENVEIIPLETGAAAAAFANGQADAVSAFPPFWLTALNRQDSKEFCRQRV